MPPPKKRKLTKALKTGIQFISCEDPDESKKSPYVNSPTKLLTVGYERYKHLRKFWTTNGMNYLPRTLMFEKRAKLPPTLKFGEKGVIPKLEIGRPSIFDQPLITRIVFEGIDDNNKDGSMDTTIIDVDLIQLQEDDDIIEVDSSGEPIDTSFPLSYRFPVIRNPSQPAKPRSKLQKAPTSPFSVTVPMSTWSKVKQQYEISPRKLVIVRCRLDRQKKNYKYGDIRTPRAGRRNSMPKSEWCYGIIEINNKDEAEFADGNDEMELEMKWISPNVAMKEESWSPKTYCDGIKFNATGLDATDQSDPPKLKIRVFKSRIQQRSFQNVLEELEFKKRRYRLHELTRHLRKSGAPVSLINGDDVRPALERVSYSFKQQLDTRGTNDDGGGRSTTDEDQNDATKRGEPSTSTSDQAGPSSTNKEIMPVATLVVSSRVCPFCEQKCTDTYALLFHFRTSHDRYSFIAKEKDDHCLVEVAPVDTYDGKPEARLIRERLSTRKGSPMKLVGAGTRMYNYRPKNKRREVIDTLAKRDLSEFATVRETAESNVHKLLRQHKRLYYHTQTRQPVRSGEFDYDSDSETYPDWFKEKSESLIHEISDLNVGEKKIMALWTSHVMDTGCICDEQIFPTCEKFVAKYGRRINAEKLTNNCILHLANLHQFGLLDPAQVLRLSKQIHALKY